MTFKALCEARYSCRAYKDEAVPQELLDYVLECARLAPSACNRQPWRLHLATSPVTLERLHRCYDRPWFAAAPAVIVVTVDTSAAWVRSFDNKNHADIDAAILTEHLCLAAAEQGLGTCWICAFNPAMCREALRLPQGIEPVALVPIGFPATSPNAKSRKPLGDILVKD